MELLEGNKNEKGMQQEKRSMEGDEESELGDEEIEQISKIKKGKQQEWIGGATRSEKRPGYITGI